MVVPAVLWSPCSSDTATAAASSTGVSRRPAISERMPRRKKRSEFMSDHTTRMGLGTKKRLIVRSSTSSAISPTTEASSTLVAAMLTVWPATSSNESALSWLRTSVRPSAPGAYEIAMLPVRG